MIIFAFKKYAGSNEYIQQSDILPYEIINLKHISE